MKGRYITGTSGWSYDHWQEIFYPQGLNAAKRLEYYASRFDSVEINNTFYRLPSEETFIKWRETVTDDFLFSVKASRYITHMKKLKNCEPSIAGFLEKSGLLGHKLGPILFQLPPGWHFNGERLSTFLSLLDPRFKYAFEFRDMSWFNDEAYRLLEKHGAALCLYHMPGFETPQILTAPFAYLRFHGTNYLYCGSYPEEEICRWAEIIKKFSNKGIDIYTYFNNDAEANAVKDALRLKKALNEERG